VRRAREASKRIDAEAGTHEEAGAAMEERVEVAADSVVPAVAQPSQREWTWWAHTGGGNAPAFKPPSIPPDDAPYGS
jgi:hypothetical protein